IGAADEHAVIAEGDDALDVAGEPRLVERTLPGEGRHGDVEDAFQARLRLLTVLHSYSPCNWLRVDAGESARHGAELAPARFRDDDGFRDPYGETSVDAEGGRQVECHARLERGL